MRDYYSQLGLSYNQPICLHTGVLNIGHQEVQLRSSISHNSIHLQVKGFQSLLRLHATLGINYRSAHLASGHLTLLTGPDANYNWISFLVNI